MEGTAEVNEAMDNSAEAFHIKGKEIEESQPQPGSALETPAANVALDGRWTENLSVRSPETFMETLAGKGFDPSLQSGSEPPCTGGMVEELTLKNYRSPKLYAGGCSSSGEEPPARRGMWPNLTRLASGPRRDEASKELLPDREDLGNSFMPQFSVRGPLPFPPLEPYFSTASDHIADSDKRIGSSNALSRLPGGLRTKVLPASGFPQFMVKNTLKGKGISYRHQDARSAPDIAIQSQNSTIKSLDNVEIASNPSHKPNAKADANSLFGGGGGATVLDVHQGQISLREWLKPRCQKLDKVERLHMFKQVVELVHTAHSQGLVLQHLRPSYFLILPSNQVKYIGTFCPLSQIEQLVGPYVNNFDQHTKRKRYSEQGKGTHGLLSVKHHKFDDCGLQPHVYSGGSCSIGNPVDEVVASYSNAKTYESNYRGQLNLGESDKSYQKSNWPNVTTAGRQQSQSEILKLEQTWYASPEELQHSTSPFSSNIYNLGVLLFELFCKFETWEAHFAAMSDLRHRILPPSFLSESPKEAGFCLWLVHPEPSSRPKAQDILLCELVCESKDMVSVDQSSADIDEEDAEADLLLHFLLNSKEQKEKQAAKLVADLGCLEADIEDVQRRHSSKAECLSDASGVLRQFNDSSYNYSHKEPAHEKAMPRSPMSSSNEDRLMRNFDQLENAYFSMRSKIKLSETNTVARSDRDVLKIRDRCSQIEHDTGNWNEPTDPLGAFFEGLCKYARYSKFEVRGYLRSADILNSANVICSLSFDRDEDYFAAAGVSKKIKIFEFGSLLNDSVDIHYPLIELSSRSKLSCVSWNNYIKNYLASTDYDGVVQLWDASTGQGFTQYMEHQKRAWSVDFSVVDPTKLASGSDDCTVRLWSINEKNCINTIWNVANVCCVQFSSYCSHLLAFGSADYKIHCYDLRNTRIPWCTLSGHGKAVSYVKFVDSETLVSASTDNSLKLWDLNKTNASGLSTDACSLTLNGHTNEKNFVGLSVSDGYIACGSETNEVYAYYKTLPMPITYHQFGSIDPITGQETSDDNSQFVSSVCWRGKSNMVVAANSTGSIKVLQMV